MAKAGKTGDRLISRRRAPATADGVGIDPARRAGGTAAAWTRHYCERRVFRQPPIL
jgi:hypothetical protein